MATLTTPTQSITAEEFRAKASDIPADPYERLPGETVQVYRNVLSGLSEDSILIDAHAHAFTHKNIPEKFMNFDKWLSRNLVEIALRLVQPDFLQTSKLDKPELILDQLLDIYDQSPARQDDVKKMYIWLLMMDMERGIGGDIKEPFEKQVDKVCRLVKNYEHTGEETNFRANTQLLPFLAVDPHNPWAYEYVLSAFIKDYNNTPSSGLDNVAPFVGLKIYPALGYVPYHPVLMDIFEVCEAKNIPVTTHAGGHRTHPSFDEVEVQYRNFENDEWVDKKKLLSLEGMRQKHFAKFFLDPVHWAKVIKAFPRLHLNLAHFGSNRDWLDYRKGRFNMVDRTLDLIRNSEHVYADFSYAFYSKVNIKAIYSDMLNDAILARRVIYGSDFYLCQVEKGNLKDFYANVSEIFHNEELKKNLFYKNALRFLLG